MRSVITLAHYDESLLCSISDSCQLDRTLKTTTNGLGNVVQYCRLFPQLDCDYNGFWRLLIKGFCHAHRCALERLLVSNRQRRSRLDYDFGKKLAHRHACRFRLQKIEQLS
jgi:hypothetical protein